MHGHLSELPIQNLYLPILFRLLFITFDRQNDVNPYEKSALLEKAICCTRIWWKGISFYM